VRVLGAAGFPAREAAASGEALRLARGPGIRIDLVLLEVVTPTRRGGDLVGEVVPGVAEESLGSLRDAGGTVSFRPFLC